MSGPPLPAGSSVETLRPICDQSTTSVAVPVPIATVSRPPVITTRSLPDPVSMTSS